MIDLDPQAVVKSPWLWDKKTIIWAEGVLADRAAWADAEIVAKRLAEGL